MDATRTAVWMTVGVVVGAAFVSGPLLGSVDLTSSERGERLFCEPSGTLDATVERVPTDSLAIESGRFGTDQHALVGDGVRLRVANVTGCIVVSYSLEIEALGFSSVTHNYVTAESNGVQHLAAVGGIFDSERITEASYDATVTIDVRGQTNRTVYRENVTIPVEE